MRPEFLCLLGRVAVQYLLGTTLSMGRLRRQVARYRGIPTIVTYHPAYLLRNPSAKKDAWEDLQLLMTAMGIPLPSRKKTQSSPPRDRLQLLLTARRAGQRTQGQAAPRAWSLRNIKIGELE